MTSLATTSHCNTDTFTFSLSPNLKCTHREPSLNRMSISPPIHTDDLDTLPDNTELIEILTARYDTGVLLRYVLTERSRTPQTRTQPAPPHQRTLQTSKPVVPETCTSQRRTTRTSSKATSRSTGDTRTTTETSPQSPSTNNSRSLHRVSFSHLELADQSSLTVG